MSVQCPLCGFRYEPVERSCPSCPMRRTCWVVCCPNCGYGVPPESSLVRLWRSMKRSLERPKDAAKKTG